MGYDYNQMKAYILGAMEDNKVNKTELEAYYKTVCTRWSWCDKEVCAIINKI